MKDPIKSRAAITARTSKHHLAKWEAFHVVRSLRYFEVVFAQHYFKNE